jgi:hypothetical protein
MSVSEDVRIGTVKPERDAAFLRVLVEARDEPDPRSVSRIANETLGVDWRGQQWQAAPLFPATDDDREGLSSFFEVTGAVEAYRLQQIAWEITYRLRDANAFSSVRPDLPTGTYQLDELTEREGLFGSTKDLPESNEPIWALDNVRVRDAWQLEPPEGGKRRGEGILVGHPDTGYTRHPQVGLDALDLDHDLDLVARPNDDDAEDPLDLASFPLESFPAHGTGTGSVIAGRGEGRLTGVAPAARLLPVRAVRSVVQIFDGDVASSIAHCVNNGVHVISMSLGGLAFRGLEGAIDRAVRRGVIVMAAAGNFVPGRWVVWPARYRNCIAVAATNARNTTWSGSSRGRQIEIAAPGDGVWVASWDLGVRPPMPAGLNRSRGTSHAVAHLAGVAALWLAYHGRDRLVARFGAENLSGAFRSLVRASSRTPDGWDSESWGSGIVDAHSLLRSSLPTRGEVEELEVKAADLVRADSAPLETITMMVPGRSRNEVATRLTALFAGAEEGVGAAEERLERYGDELTYLMLENREVRKAVAQEDFEGAFVGPAASLRGALRRTGSRSLVQELSVG